VSGANDAVRVDVMTSGQVIVQSGDSGWVSLSGITFLASGAATSNNWANGVWQNGWVNYSATGNSWGDLKYAKDTLGRVHTEGLGRAGTTTTNTVLTNSLNISGFTPSNRSIMPARAFANGAVDIDTSGQMLVRYVGSWASVAFVYYPSTFNSWSSVSMTNGWIPYGSVYSGAQCHKGSDDLVILRGLIKGGSNGTSSTSLNSVGCGLHSDGRQILPSWLSGNNPGRIDVLDTGELFFSASSATWTTLDGIRFIAD